jgi:large subunit ribosomal protein L7/L12
VQRGGADCCAAAGRLRRAVAEEKTEFNVISLRRERRKIQVIKVVASLPAGLEGSQRPGRWRAKAGQRSRPKAEAETIKKKLEEQGAKVEIK